MNKLHFLLLIFFVSCSSPNCDIVIQNGIVIDGTGSPRFIGTIAQTLGPEALLKFIDPSEAIKRLAAAQGIDVLNLVRTAEQLAQLKDETVQDKTNQSLVDQAGQLAGTPLMDPSRNPDLADQAAAVLGNLQPPEE